MTWQQKITDREHSAREDVPATDPKVAPEDNDRHDSQDVESDAESSTSVLIDEPRPIKRRKKSASIESKAKAKSTKTATAGPKTKKKETDMSPDEVEIKRLQSWLLKCGVRKLWHKELEPYDTPKAKIGHLKTMLTDIGMQGRYSADKASAIKERRELEADVSALQQLNEPAEDSSSAESAVAPEAKRQRVQSRFVDFGDDSDEE